MIKELKAGVKREELDKVSCFEADSKDWDEIVLNSDIPVVVNFWAENCPYCEILMPIFERLSKDYDGKMRFVKLNAEKAGDIATIYGVMSIPMLKFFCSGREVYGFLGHITEEELRLELDRIYSRHTSCLAKSSQLQRDTMYV